MNSSVPTKRTDPIRTHGTLDILKLLTALLIIVVAALIPVTHWPAHGLLLVFVFVLLTLQDVPIQWIWQRLKWFLPLIAMFAISVPLSQGFAKGGELMAAMIIRGTVSFLTVLWLSQSLPFPRLLKTLKRCGVPVILLSMLSMMHRYSIVLWNEFLAMRTAREARLFANTSLTTRWMSNARMIGMLLIRSLTKAERIHDAMSARGWNGTMPEFEFTQDSNS